MTYRFGRTSKLRYAATVSGIPAYTDGRIYGAAPSPEAIPAGCHYDAKQKKIVCTDTGDPLGYHQSTLSKPQRAGKKKRRYAKTGRVKKRRLSSMRAKCPTGMHYEAEPYPHCEIDRASTKR